MGRKTWIDSDIWTDIRKHLDPVDERIYTRLLCNPNGNIAGYFLLDTMWLAGSVGITEDELIARLKSQTKYWMFDENTSQVLIPTYTKYNTISGSKQFAALNKAIKPLSICKLHLYLVCCLEKYSGIGTSKAIDANILREVLRASSRWKGKDTAEPIRLLKTILNE